MDEDEPYLVYVMQLQYRHIGYTSAHTTYAGAERKLNRKAKDWGIRLSDVGVTYGISQLPVED